MAGDARSESKKRWFAPITDFRSAKAAARRGAIAGLIFSGMYVIGAVVLTYTEISPTTGHRTSLPEDERIVLIIFEIVVVALMLFLSWRVSTARGFISAAVLLLWFVGEVVTKMIAGTAHIGWMFFYLAVALAMIEGLRGCWHGRRLHNLPEPATFD